MADANAPVNLYDHLLFNAINMMMTEIYYDRSWREQAFFMIEEALEGASADHPNVAPLIDAASKLQYAWNFQGTRVERGNEWNHARMFACKACTEFSKWRACLSQASLRRQFEVIEGGAG